jgi:hypothetical protein
MKRFLISLIIISGLIACEKKDDTILKKTTVCFEYYSINYAWSLTYMHWIIDSEGNVRVNRKADSLVWLNQIEYDKRVSYFDTVLYRIEAAEFSNYVKMIPHASKGQIDTIDQNITDFGTIAYNCYLGDKLITLRSINEEMDCSNQDTSAIKIYRWMTNMHFK